MLDSRFTLKGTGVTYAPSRSYDTEHIRIEVDLNIDKEVIKGRCTTVLRAITGAARQMTFDAVNFKVGKVLWNGKRTSHTTRNGKLIVSPRGRVKEGEHVEVEVNYTVTKPKLGLFFVKPNKLYRKRPTQVWTQGEDEFSRYWFPCHDAPHERTTTEVIATVPGGFTAVSNGELVKTTHTKRPKTSTFHWRQSIPHATYLVTLTAGRFSVIKDKWRNIPVTYYCEKGREKDAKRAFGKTPKMLEFFSNAIGTDYPYAKYAQIAAAEFIYGGMENTSATTQTDMALLDKRASLDYTSDELVAHELAHQWFGDYLTCKEWSHAWLNESFATYFDALFKRNDLGGDEFLYAIYKNAAEYFEEDKGKYRRPIVTRRYKRPTDLFDRHLYEKGSVVLYMLHHILGEALFWKSIRTYVARNKGQVVETRDLINAIEAATGRNMQQFFDQWVYGGGHPTYRVRTWWDKRKKRISVRIVQAHGKTSETGLFNVETEILFRTKKGEKKVKVEINKASHLIQVTLDSEPDMILFDPSHKLLKTLDFPRTETQLINQLRKATNPLSRIDAAYNLARKGTEKSIEALRKALLKDSFWGVQAEVARALGSMAREEASMVLVHSLDVIDHPKVRTAIYQSLMSFKTQRVANEVAKKVKKEASYFAEGSALRLLGLFRHPKAEDILMDALEKDSWNEVIRISAIEGLAQTKNKKYVPLFLSYTKEGKHQRLRMAAIRSLMRFAGDDDSIQGRFIELAEDSFLLVQIAAVRALHLVGDERAVPVLKKLMKGDRDGRLKRLSEEAVLKITKGFD